MTRPAATPRGHTRKQGGGWHHEIRDTPVSVRAQKEKSGHQMLNEDARCPTCGAPKHRGGRRKLPVDVGFLSDAYRRTHSVRAAARAAGISPARAYDRLRELGLVGAAIRHTQRKAG